MLRLRVGLAVLGPGDQHREVQSVQHVVDAVERVADAQLLFEDALAAWPIRSANSSASSGLRSVICMTVS